MSRGRIQRNVLVAIASVAFVALVLALHGAPAPIVRLSLATAYLSLVLLGTTLVLGPLNLVRGRSNPLSTFLRRDLGIAAAIAGVAHAGIGLGVHMGGKWWLYFVKPGGAGRTLRPRVDPFGIANWTGLLVSLVLIGLLLLSSDRAIVRLGPARWKSLQRWSYPAAAVTIVHAWLYQLAEKRLLPAAALVGAVALTTLAFQIAGIRARGGRT